LAAFVSGFAKDPAFRTLDGQTIKYTELIAAPKTILFVWTTWCPYCRQELRRLTEEDIPFGDVMIYFVNAGERPAVVSRFADSQKIRSQFRKRVILDTQDFIVDKFDVSAIPAYIFIKDQKLVYRSFYFDQDLLRSVFKK